MGFPNFRDKYSKDPVFTPKDFLLYLKKIKRYPAFTAPRGMIICYQNGLLEHVLRNHKTTRVSGLSRGMYLLDETDGRAGIVGNFGIGAPAAGVILEELIASGVGRFVSIGTAGTLQKNIRTGALMVCEKAVRDEGTSHHYVKPAKYAYPSAEITAQMKTALKKLGRKYFAGATWTVDAPYRETSAEVRRYQKEGIATVEMEASALFSIARCRGAQLGAVFTISDSLADLKWNPGFHAGRTGKGLEILYKAAVSALIGG